MYRHSTPEGLEAAWIREMLEKDTDGRYEIYCPQGSRYPHTVWNPQTEYCIFTGDAWEQSKSKGPLEERTQVYCPASCSSKNHNLSSKHILWDPTNRELFYFEDIYGYWYGVKKLFGFQIPEDVSAFISDIHEDRHGIRIPVRKLGLYPHNIGMPASIPRRGGKPPLPKFQTQAESEWLEEKKRYEEEALKATQEKADWQKERETFLKEAEARDQTLLQLQEEASAAALEKSEVMSMFTSLKEAMDSNAKTTLDTIRNEFKLSIEAVGEKPEVRGSNTIRRIGSDSNILNTLQQYRKKRAAQSEWKSEEQNEQSTARN